MPIVETISQTILLKKSIEEKYSGGINQFKEDYKWGGSEVDGEDAELLGLSFMGEHLDDIPEVLVPDLDYVHVSRYNKRDTGLVSWLKFNYVYYWHKDSKSGGTHPYCIKLDPKVDEVLEWVTEQNGLKSIW